MIELRPVDRDNVQTVLRLEVHEGQRNFVASNAVSLAQAYAWAEFQPVALYAGGEPVGFAVHAVEDGKLWLVRFMIDRAHQGRGYGRAGLAALLDHLRATTDFEEIHLGVVPENTAAIALYRSFGFVPTGKMSEGEAEMAAPLREPVVTSGVRNP